MSGDWRLKLYRGTYAAVKFVDRKTVRRSLGTKDRESAQRALIDLNKPEIGHTVADIVEAYLTDKDKTAIRAQGLRDAWKQSSPHFGPLRPDQITRTVCREYIRYRKGMGRKPATIRKEIEVVRAGLRFNKKEDGAVFELPPAPPARERYLTKDEVRRLVRAARPFPHIRAFVVLMLATGARGSALLQLTWDRVDFDRKLITLALGDAGDEARKPRARVPINRRAQRYLRILHAARTSNHVIEWAGQPVKSVKKGFGSAVVAAKLKGVTPHVLRHTAASWMASAGVPMFEISKYMGHSDTRVTERRYAHLSPEYLRSASEKLDW